MCVCVYARARARGVCGAWCACACVCVRAWCVRACEGVVCVFMCDVCVRARACVYVVHWSGVNLRMSGAIPLIRLYTFIKWPGKSLRYDIGKFIVMNATPDQRTTHTHTHTHT